MIQSGIWMTLWFLACNTWWVIEKTRCSGYCWACTGTRLTLHNSLNFLSSRQNPRWTREELEIPDWLVLTDYHIPRAAISCTLEMLKMCQWIWEETSLHKWNRNFIHRPILYRSQVLEEMTCRIHFHHRRHRQVLSALCSASFVQVTRLVHPWDDDSKIDSRTFQNRSMEGHHVLSCVVARCHLRWLNFTALIKQGRVQSDFIRHRVGSAITWSIDRQT